MERFSLEQFEEYADPVLTSQEILERKTAALESQSFFRTVAETDGLTPLLQLMVQSALPFI